MSTDTEDSFRSLLEDIVGTLASTKLALERLYESGEGQISIQELLDVLMKFEEISPPIEVTDDIQEKMSLFLFELQTFTNQLRAKYSDFLSSAELRQFEDGERRIEGLKKLLVFHKLMRQVADGKDLLARVRKFYAGMIELSEISEKYIPYFPAHLIETIKNIALSFLAGSTLELLEQSTISQEVVDYLAAIKNTARGILWQLDNYKKGKKHTAGELVDWLETAPSWTGDDFEECLEYVNWVRK